MIIFDTNALYGLHRNSPKFDLLMAFKHSGSHSIGIPWMVREELVAQQVLEYAIAYDSAGSAMKSLNRKMPWGTFGRLPAREIETAKEYWRSQYEEVLTVLEIRVDDAKAALAREAYCQKPAKTDPKSKGGARDVAIWLSVIDYLRKHPMETVYFVSANVRDFGDGVSYPAPMSEDLGGMKPRLSLLASFEDFISHFTEGIEIDIERVKGFLTDLVSDWLTPIESSAGRTLKGRFDGTRIEDGSFEFLQWHAWLLAPSAVVRSVSDASGHKIANAEWYTATVSWILVGTALPTIPLSATAIRGSSRVACEWRTRVLFSAGDTKKLTILDFERPRALDPNARAEFQPLIETAIQAYKAHSTIMFGALASVLIGEDEGINTIGHPDIIYFGDTNPD